MSITLYRMLYLLHFSVVYPSKFDVIHDEAVKVEDLPPNLFHRSNDWHR